MSSKHFLLTILAIAINSAIGAPPSVDTPAFKGYAYALDPVAKGACKPADINDKGQVTGINYRNIYHHTNALAFVTGPNGIGSTPLTLGGKDSSAAAINSKGQVVGISESSDPDAPFTGFITDPGGSNIRPIGPPGATMLAINDLGQIAGELNGIAFLTEPNGKNYKFIDSLGTFTSVYGINSSGQLTGQFSDQHTIYHAFVTGPNGTGMIDLNLPGASYSFGVDINDLGEVTGEQWIGQDGLREQYIASADGLNTRLLGTLGNLPGGRSEGGGINNKGIVVGISSKGDKYGRIYVTFTGPDGVMRNLNRYVQNLPADVYLTGSPVINNRNQIAASATDGKCYLVCPDENCQKTKP